MEKIQQEFIINKLKEYGCEIDEAMPRFGNNSEFYCTLLAMVPEDEAFLNLEKALNSKNIKEAFEQAHTLKGVLGNMGLTPMYNKTILIVEPLRQGKLDNVETNFKELMHDLAVLKNILNDAQGVK